MRLIEYLYKNVAFRIIDITRKTNALYAYGKIRRNVELNRELLLQLQLERLRDLFVHCWNNVPYYIKLFKKYSIDPYNADPLESLSKLPLLTKDTIRKNFDDLKAINFNQYIPRRKSTSGSTGQPLNYFWDKRTHSYAWANIWRSWNTAGYRLGQCYATLAGGALLPEKVSIKDKVYLFLNHSIHLPAYHLNDTVMEKYVRLLKEKKPEIMYGYPSAIWEFAQFVERRKEKINFRYVITTSEMLFVKERKDIERIFNCEVFDVYGANDAGILSYECHVHDGYHYSMESAYVEITDNDGQSLKNGDVGKVVSTNLICYAMPFLRYTPGDQAALCDDICSCGNSLVKIIKVTGRERDFVINKEGRKIHGAFFNHFAPFYKARSIHRFQIIQKNTGEVIVLLIPSRKKVDSREKENFLVQLKKGLDPMDINIRTVDELNYTKTGKFRIINRDAQFN